MDGGEVGVGFVLGESRFLPFPSLYWDTNRDGRIDTTVVNGIITGLTFTDAGNYRPGFAPIVTLSGGGGNSASIIVRALGPVSSNAIVGGSSVISNLTVDQDIGTIYNGAIGGVGANQNNLGLIKSGVGALTLSGSVLSYAGQTTVTGGRRSITGGQSAPLQTSSVKVTTGAILNLNNTVGQTIDLGSGSLNLGAGTSGSASLGLDVGSLTTFDRIVTTGAATAANKVIVNLTGLPGLAAGTYDLFTAGSGLNGTSYLLDNCIYTFIKNAQIKFMFGRKVLIQDWLTNTRSLSNVIHRRQMKSFFGEDFKPRNHNLGASSGVLGISRAG